MRNNKIKSKLVSIFLAVVLSLGFLLPSFQMNKVYGANESIQTTNDDDTDYNPSDYGMDEFLNQFDDYECTLDTNLTQALVSATKYVDNYTEIYETRFNYLDDGLRLFEITVKTYNNRREIVAEDNYIALLYFDEEEDEYYVNSNDEIISLSELIEEYDMESRIAGVDDVAIAIASLAVAAVIICYPYVKTVVTTVITWVSSFWRWLRGKFVAKNVSTTITYYRINVFDRELDMEKVENWDSNQYDVGNYHLAIVLGPAVYISAQDVTEGEAVGVLTIEKEVYMEGFKCRLNTYTRKQLDARNIAEQAALNNDRHGGLLLHSYHGGNKAGVYFAHYHPGPRGMRGLPHSFFGTPKFII